MFVSIKTDKLDDSFLSPTITFTLITALPMIKATHPNTHAHTNTFVTSLSGDTPVEEYVCVCLPKARTRCSPVSAEAYGKTYKNI